MAEQDETEIEPVIKTVGRKAWLLNDIESGDRHMWLSTDLYVETEQFR